MVACQWKAQQFLRMPKGSVEYCVQKMQTFGIPPSNPNVFHQKVLDVLFLRKRIETYQMGLEMNKNAYLFGKKKVQEFCVYPLPYFCLQKND